ncbi:hypothetical protein SEPL_496 [Salmonella phage SE_PL]|uniref:hypothetical protein n=1 Tax=Salmonella enterica TaxID=28901 RepID=UPI000FDF724B|nr:hypothetical protein CPT_Munch_472 [Salmonella phage Munch]EAZ2022744.1 hypothetical protein [Salmonella enterica]ECV9083878.1 hypothetical protein [Salmonella enterica subsp. enterica serovar Infantis]MCP0435526.1 hypothetical protein [Salmonella enterica subsp. enterica serovar Mbandaka]QCW18575.1 hypothetical protein 7t3_054 [Salmonella phage 7t3]QIG63109.1 hypothetical protein SEPL_496 [Salmonella phage SE_PL]WNV47555.1 hypothetical protein [Klebsiella phage fENko-Kae01]
MSENVVNRNKLLERGLMLIVGATMSLEDTGSTGQYLVKMGTMKLVLSRNFTEVAISKHYVTIRWMSESIVLSRATSEEDYFQKMCLDDSYCDEEYEKGIKEFFDLYMKSLYRNFAIGGFLEGAYAEDIENDQ